MKERISEIAQEIENILESGDNDCKPITIAHYVESKCVLKEDLPSVNELIEIINNGFDVTDDYGEASEGLAKEIAKRIGKEER